MKDYIETKNLRMCDGLIPVLHLVFPYEKKPPNHQCLDFFCVFGLAIQRENLKR